MRLLPLAFILCAAPLRAEEDPRALHTSAQHEYDLGHFRQSLDLFEKLYKLKPLPGLLFNIAQCHRKLGELKEAASTYRSFLVKDEGRSLETIDAQELLAQVEEAIRQQEATEALRVEAAASAASAQNAQGKTAPALALEPPPLVIGARAPPPAAPRPHFVSYGLLAGGGVALLSGVVLGARSVAAGNSLANNPHSRDQIAALSSTKTFDAKLADVLFAATLGLGVGAVLTW